MGLSLYVTIGSKKKKKKEKNQVGIGSFKKPGGVGSEQMSPLTHAKHMWYKTGFAGYLGINRQRALSALCIMSVRMCLRTAMWNCLSSVLGDKQN